MAVKLKKDAFVRNLIKNHKLVNHIDKAIGAGEFTWSASFGAKQGDDAFHPSGDCIPSPYSLYLSRMTDERRPLTASMLKTFQVGHFWHAYIQHILVEQLNFCTWEEVERKGEKRWGDGRYQWATGSADVAPCRIPAQGDYLVDIKTMGAFDFKQNNIPSWCAAKYEAQINIYMDWFDLEQAIILCVSKDSPHDFKEFLFRRNQPLIDAIYSKWELVSHCLAEDVEPDPDYDPELPLTGPRP
jgi:hypothetical protein